VLPPLSITFVASDFTSAFQLAVAINLGLTIFRQMRMPLEGNLANRIARLADAYSQAARDANNSHKDIERIAIDAAKAAGDIDWPQYLDPRRHAAATELMVGTLTRAPECRFEKKLSLWNRM
jgi:hypothetical protein